MHRTTTLPHPLVILSFLLCFLVLYFDSKLPLNDPDTGWHLAAGQYILAHGIPAHDPWSFTAGDTTWYNLSWLWDVIVSLLAQPFGLRGAFYAIIIFESGLVALAVSNLRRRAGLHDDAIILVLLALVLAFREFAPLRPHTATFFFILLFQRILHESREQASRRALRYLPWLMLPWANMHGGFFVGFVLLGAYGIEALASRDHAWLKRLIITGVWMASAALLNPQNLHMFEAIGRTAGSGITSVIQEWMPFNFGFDMSGTMWLVLMFACNPRGNEAPLADRILSYAWLVAALLHTRNSMVFMLISAPFVAINLQQWVNWLEFWRTHPRTQIADSPALRRKFTCATALLVFAFLLPPTERTLYPQDREGKAYDFSSVAPLLTGPYSHLRLLNDYSMGGVLIYKLGGKFPVFVDGRAGTAYPESVLNDYLLFMQLGSGWEAALEKYDIDGLLLFRNSNFVTVYNFGAYHDRWIRTVKGDPQVFLKRCADDDDAMKATPKRCATESERQ
ncbi:MAG: hypothetical protein EBV03_06465 [Proteobacteria bacterium]|nr:hypothetical protein [Pseudomonadota bacterium]